MPPAVIQSELKLGKRRLEIREGRVSPMLYAANNHTVLLPFTWRGKGTLEVESLQSVFREIAFAHRVSPGTLYDAHFKNALEREGISGAGNRLMLSKGGASVAGDSILLRGVAEHIARLTGEKDAIVASLNALTALLSPRGLASRVERVCPYCLGPDTMYGRVLWDFAAVKVCPLHAIRLVEPLCGAPEEERIRGPYAVQLTGVCARCGMKGMRCQLGWPVVAEKDELWAAKNIGELIAWVSGGGQIDIATLREGIAQCFRQTGPWGDRENDAFGLPCRYIREWTKGVAKPSLQALLALASKCQTSLISVFQATVGKRSGGQSGHTYYRFASTDCRPRGSDRFPKNRGIVRNELRDLINEEGIGNVSGLRLAERLKVSDTYLEKNFPKEWAECVRIRADNRRLHAQSRESDLLGMVRDAIKRVRENGFFPTKNKVYAAMQPLPRRFGAREVGQLIGKCLKELNL